MEKAWTKVNAVERLSGPAEDKLNAQRRTKDLAENRDDHVKQDGEAAKKVGMCNRL